MNARIACILASVLILLGSTVAFAAESVEPKTGGNVSWLGTIDDDVFGAGQTVDVDAEISGDAFLTGGTVTTAGSVQRSVYASGGKLRLKGDVGSDLIGAGGDVESTSNVGHNLVLAGGDVTITGDITGRAIAAGGHVQLGRMAMVHRDAWLAGGSVEVDGNVAGGAKLTGGTIVIRGHIAGNVMARGQKVELQSGARIDGNLDVYSPDDPVIDSGATVGGTVSKHVTASQMKWVGGFVWIAVILTVIFYVFLFLVGLLMVVFGPLFVERSHEILTRQGFAALGVGAVITLATPPVVLLLMISIIGIPFALALILVYGLATMLAIPVLGTSVAFSLAGRTARGITRGRVILYYVLVLVVLWVIGWIPFLGALAWFIFGMLGIGIMALHIFGGRRRAVAAA